ncbi:thermonuclease family protein [Aliikangiella maris]|uniref:Thermonuclease family protein n=2 Tax=Aliikangiella maris TaxID=3162458 RepID=A0ABV3MSX6_9GAMM
MQCQFSKKTRSSVFFIVCVLPLCFVLAKAQELCPSFATLKPSLQTDTVRWIPDGDTIHTHSGHKLRLLHINAPEINPRSTKPAEPLAKSAQHHLHQLVKPGQPIYWLPDVRSQDKYGRTLALAFNEKGQFINSAMLTSGFAQLLVIPPNIMFVDCLQQAEQTARNKKAGLWQNNQFQPIAAKNLQYSSGFHQIQGTITEIRLTRSEFHFHLDHTLWVIISKKDQPYFSPSSQKVKSMTTKSATFQSETVSLKQLQVGKKIILRGYVYLNKGLRKIKLRHPAMIINLEQVKSEKNSF